MQGTTASQLIIGTPDADRKRTSSATSTDAEVGSIKDLAALLRMRSIQMTAWAALQQAVPAQMSARATAPDRTVTTAHRPTQPCLPLTASTSDGIDEDPAVNRIDPLVSNIEIEHSVEARWVLAGRPPHRLVSNLVGQATFERRTDIYMDPSNDDTNVKFRGGRRLQVKLRRWWRRYPFDCGAIGRVEGWTKWSFSDDECAAAPIAIAGKSGWVSVNKALWILDISGRDAGHVEIGQLAVPDDRSMYWTLCVEVPTETAVGVADAPLHAVCRGLHALEPWLPHDELRLTTPTSYPEWLRSLPPTAGTDSPCRFDAKSPELEASTPRR